MTPQTFSYAMIGLSTSVLVFFIAYKDDDTPNSDDKPSNSDDKPSKSDNKLPEEDKEEYDFDKEEEEPLRMGGSRALDKSKHGKNTKTRKKGNKKHK